MNAAPHAIPTVDARAARQAAQWLMRLHERPSEADREACRAWRSADPSHELAWQRAEQVGNLLGMLPASLAMPVLDRPARLDRRATLRSLAMLIGAGPVAWTAYRSVPWQAWTADTRTARGEIRTLTLDDGTRLTLNTATAVDIAFDDATRLVRLHEGEIHAGTAPDPGRRPFVVQTGNGRIRALGTRFMVRREDGLAISRTHVAVTQGAVELRTANAQDTPRILHAGYQASFDDDVVTGPTALPAHADAWINGVLIADDTPLGSIAAQLNRYRPGIVRCHPAVADLRVSGALQLGDTDQLLALLQGSLPIRVVQRTRFWVSLEPA